MQTRRIESSRNKETTKNVGRDSEKNTYIHIQKKTLEYSQKSKKSRDRLELAARGERILSATNLLKEEQKKTNKTRENKRDYEILCCR